MQATATLPTTATGRHVLTGLGVLALASSVVPGIVRGSTPQMTASVRANPFVINPQTAQALQGFAGSIATTSSALTALRASHGSLFRRSMILRWKEPAPPRRCPDAAGSDAGRVDVNCPEPKPIVRREKVTLWFDDYLLHSDSPRHDEIAGLTDTFERLDRVGGGAARRLQSRGLKDIRTELIPAELQALGDTDFANAMNFQWSSSEWGVGGPVAFASVFGVSLAAISLLYGLAWKNSPNARPGSEPYRDRRAFLRTVLAGLGAGFGLSNMGGDDNSGAIARGRATIRNAIVSAGSMTDDQLFRRFFQMSPQQLSTTLLANSRSFAQRLNHLNTRDLSTAFAIGFNTLETRTTQRIREIQDERPKAFGFERELDRETHGLVLEADNHLRLARQTAHRMVGEQQAIAQFLSSESIHALAPAMRALFISDSIERSASKEMSGRYGAIARDVGLYVAIPLGALLLSEIPGPHHGAIHRVVQGAGRWMDGWILGEKICCPARLNYPD